MTDQEFGSNSYALVEELSKLSFVLLTSRILVRVLVYVNTVLVTSRAEEMTVRTEDTLSLDYRTGYEI